MGKFMAAMMLWSAAGAAAALAQAPESVTVTGTRQQTITRFLKTVTTPTHMTGKLARWETPICPAVLGLDEAAAAAVIARLKDVALGAGARFAKEKDCEPNIEIVFTDTPQLTIDNVRDTAPELLGYHNGSEERAKLATVSRPIQAWYTTVTRDLRGHSYVDGPRVANSPAQGTFVILPCKLTGQNRQLQMGPAGARFEGVGWCVSRLDYAIKADVEGSRIANGLRSGFHHIIITVDPDKLTQRDGINDYVAMLALTQLSSLDRCQDMPSIVNMLPAACEQSAAALTPGDLGYLRGLYGMNADKLAQGQQNEIARQMEKAMVGQ